MISYKEKNKSVSFIFVEGYVNGDDANFIDLIAVPVEMIFKIFVGKKLVPGENFFKFDCKMDEFWLKLHTNFNLGVASYASGIFLKIGLKV